MRILMTGGGTGGSVTPLIALYQELKKRLPSYDFIWLGTKFGPETKLLSVYQDIKFKTIKSGKLRRYFSIQNLNDFFRIIFGFFQSVWICLRERPSIVLTAGSYVSVPVVWAAWLLRIPILIHQQDIEIGLANKLMAPFASKITVAFPELIDYFPNKKTIYTGNPVRSEFIINNNELKSEKIKKDYGLEKSKPLILVIGGGTGARGLNDLIVQTAPLLIKNYSIVHLTGYDYTRKSEIKFVHANYRSFDFINEDLPGFMKASDLVITRAGLGTLSELAALAKAVVIVPLPASQQLKNAIYFEEHGAAIVCDQQKTTPEKFAEIINRLLSDKKSLINLSAEIYKINKNNASSHIADYIENLIN